MSPVDGHKIGHVHLLRIGISRTSCASFAADGAEVLFNISNDGWFGKSAARQQHLEIVRMRAAENRRWILRATNDGITAHHRSGGPPARDPAAICGGRFAHRLHLHPGAHVLHTVWRLVPDAVRGGGGGSADQCHLLFPATRDAARLRRPRLPNATYFSRSRTPALIVGQDSSPAADVHVGVFLLGCGPIFVYKERVLEDPRRPGGLPHKLCSIPTLRKVSGGGSADRHAPHACWELPR